MANNRSNSNKKDSNYKNRSDRNSNRPKSKVVSINSILSSKNDPAWYNRLTQLFKDSILISFFNQLGARFKFLRRYRRIAGVMGLRTMTTPGTSTNINSPASIAAIGMYEATRKALNKPISEYEPADMLAYTFSSSDILSQYVNMHRLIKIINTWDATNLYTPRAIIAEAYVPGDHFDEFYNDLINNMADYRYRFNLAITKALSFLYMPEDFAIVKRHAWLFGNLFMDHKSTKAQVYLHTKWQYWKFDEETYDTGSAVSCNEYWPVDYTGDYTFERYLSIFEECIEALRNSSSVRAIVADMRQAFKDHNEFGMDFVKETDVIEFNNSDEVLSQIENTEVLPWYIGRANHQVTNRPFDITQDPNSNCVLFDPEFTCNVQYMNISHGEHILNLHWDNPTDDDKMVATRGKWTWRETGATSTAVKMKVNTASDIVVGMYILTDPDDVNSAFGGVELDPYMHIRGTNTDPYLKAISDIVSFDWNPQVFISPDATTTTDSTYYPLIEFDNYTVVDDSIIDRANLTALLSMWNIPEHGEFSF